MTPTTIILGPANNGNVPRATTAGMFAAQDDLRASAAVPGRDAAAVPSMKICFVLPCAGTRGAPRSLLETITVLRQRGAQCFAILPHHGPLVAELHKHDVQTRIIPYKVWMTHRHQKFWKRALRPLLNLRHALPIARQIRQWNCDLVYTNTVSVGIGGIAAMLAGRPHVWHIREFGWEDHKQPFDWGDRITGWLINKLSVLCLVNSQAVGDKYARYVGEEKIKRAHQAVRIAMGDESAAIAPPSRFRCVIAGALQETKGQEEAIKAVAILARQNVNLELQIIGDGPQPFRDRLNKLIMDSGIADRVEFVGYVGSIAPYLRAASAVLVCSRCEAFGRVTVEGMLAGKPVIGARSGGTTELLIDGFNGYSYSPGDIEDLASKILRVHDQPEEAGKISSQAAAWAHSQFNLHRYGNEIWAALSPLVRQSPSSNVTHPFTGQDARVSPI